MRELDTLEFRDEVEAGKGICLVDFNATWCGPCKMQAPVLEELASEVDYPIYGIAPPPPPPPPPEYNVNAVPSLMIFKDGKLQETLVGFQSKEVLEEAIGKYL